MGGKTHYEDLDRDEMAQKDHPRSTHLRQAPSDTLALALGHCRDAAAAPIEGRYRCAGIRSNGLTPPKKTLR